MNRITTAVNIALAGLCLAAALASVALQVHNQSARADIAQRQQYVQMSVQLEGLYREIVRALAELSARHNDAEVRDLLQRHGITFNAAAPAPAAATPRSPQKGSQP